MEEVKKALELYRKGAKSNDIYAETGLNIEQLKEFITVEVERDRRISIELQKGHFAEEWDKVRFRLLGKKK